MKKSDKKAIKDRSTIRKLIPPGIRKTEHDLENLWDWIVVNADDKELVGAIRRFVKLKSDEAYDDGFESGRKEGYEERIKDIGHTTDISLWRQVGEERKYFDFFKKEVRKEAAQELLKLLSENNKGSWNRILNQFK